MSKYLINGTSDTLEINSGDFSTGVIRSGDIHFPRAMTSFLGKSCPECIYTLGNRSLLNGRLVFICGARECSGKGYDIAYNCGRLLSDMGFTVISGYARGVDRAAHLGALSAGGATIAFLPYGLDRIPGLREITEIASPGRILFLSDVPNYSIFHTQTALRRNKMLAAMSIATFAIEPGASGGTWYALEKACKMDKPVYFLEGTREDMVEPIEKLGAKRVPLIENTPYLEDFLSNIDNGG